MARYFFDTADGDTDTDEDGVALDGDDAAIREAIRYAGAMIHHQPDLLTARNEFIVRLRRDDGAGLAAVQITLQDMIPAVVPVFN